MQRNTQFDSGGKCWRQRGNKGDWDRESEDKDFALVPKGDEKGGVLYLLLPQVPKLATAGNISSLLGPLSVSHTGHSPPQWMELGHSQIQTVPYMSVFYIKTCEHTVSACGRHVFNVQFFGWCVPSFFFPLVCLTPAIRAHIPGLAISDLGAKAGSEGLKCWDCSPCTTRLFSASYAARHFQTVPHSSELNSRTGCICIYRHVHRDVDINLQSICTAMWWGHYGFAFFAKLWLISIGGFLFTELVSFNAHLSSLFSL